MELTEPMYQAADWLLAIVHAALVAFILPAG